MYRTEEEWMEEYLKKRSFYLWDGDPAHRHPVLTSKKHSNGFFNSRPVIEDKRLLGEAAFDLVNKVIDAGMDINRIDRVVGPQTGATKLSEFMANAIGMFRGRPCGWASPAKPAYEGGPMIWDDPDRKPLPGETVLLCEDVRTTGGSVDRAEAATIACGAKLLPMLAVLVNRSGESEADSKRIIALINRAMPAWEPDECEACKAGSQPVEKPKDNWDTLIAA